MRSLGLPVAAGNVSIFSLFRMPLGAFQPHDPLYVYEVEGRLAGLARVERESHRDEWTIVELDAVDQGDAGDIRYRLVQHLLRDGARRGVTRFHVACADRGGNVELFMQAGFARYGEETILYRGPGLAWPRLASLDPGSLGIRSTRPSDALALSRLYALVTPRPVGRLEDYRLADWERQGSQSRVPRSSLTPLLRLADVESYLQEPPGGDGDIPAAFVQVGVAQAAQPHYLRVISQPEHDPCPLIRYGLAVIGERSGLSGPRGAQGDDHGIVSCVRSYEAPLDRRLEEEGLRPVATVSLLLKEAMVRVAEPALVPAIR
jgi:hypothetical protein